MSTAIKFCGLTRAADADYATALGAAYVGVIFAGGPRMLTVERAAEVFAGVPASVRRVGVFADQPADEIRRIAARLRLDVVQLHGDFDATRVAALRAEGGLAVWAVCRLTGAHVPPTVGDLLAAGDGALIDAFSPGALGGTGETLPWGDLGVHLAPLRSRARLLALAGGLRAENVGDAIAVLAPDVVDVSSGVERTPGIKDHDRMRAFRDAVQAADHP